MASKVLTMTTAYCYSLFEKGCSKAFKAKREDHIFLSLLTILALIFRAANISSLERPGSNSSLNLRFLITSLKSSHMSLLTVSVSRLKTKGDHDVTVRPLELMSEPPA